MSTGMPATGDLYLVVGYDGSPPATRALDAAVRLLHGRAGSIEVVYVPRGRLGRGQPGAARGGARRDRAVAARR